MCLAKCLTLGSCVASALNIIYQVAAAVALHLIDDSLAELVEDFLFVITAVDTVAASIDLAQDSVNISVAPSDDPYGVVQFAAVSLDIMTEEGLLANLTITRAQGTLAAVEVFYRTETATKAGVLPASKGDGK